MSTLSAYWGEGHKRYIEPFAGSACLFFYLQPKRAILGDINADLIATYREVQDNLSEVLVSLGQLKKGHDEYYALRATDPNGLD